MKLKRMGSPLILDFSKYNQDMQELIDLLTADVIIARDIRILSCVALQGAEAIPYDINFLDKYELRTLYFTFLDSKTDSSQKKKTSSFVDKHIKAKAASYVTTDKLAQADITLLSLAAQWGFNAFDSVFKESNASLLRLLEEHEILNPYLISKKIKTESSSTEKMLQHATDIEDIVKKIIKQELTLI